MSTPSIRLLPLVLLAASFLLSGCGTVESENPLSSLRSAVPDRRLEGLWHSDDKDSSYYLYIGYRAHGQGSLMMFGRDNTGAISTIQYDFFVTKTPKHGYLNLSRAVSNLPGGTHTDRSGRYSFAEYHFSWRGQLVYSTVMGQAFSDAVEKGKLIGKVTRDRKSKEVKDTLLKDSSARILAFIESSKPADVFGPSTKFSKIGGP